MLKEVIIAVTMTCTMTPVVSPSPTSTPTVESDPYKRGFHDGIVAQYCFEICDKQKRRKEALLESRKHDKELGRGTRVYDYIKSVLPNYSKEIKENNCECD
jgi:hypothetical protein